MFYLAYWLWTRRFWLKRQWQLQQRKKGGKTKYEELVVFDDRIQTIYRVALPIDDLYDKLGATSRYVCDTSVPKYIGAGITYLAAIPLLGLLFWLAGLDVIIVTLLAMTLATPASLPGWMFGPVFGPKPQWLSVRTEDGEIQPFDLGEYFQPDDPEASFISEMLQLRDLRMVLSGGPSKQQKIQLAVTVTLLVCLVVVLFFVLTVFSG